MILVLGYIYKINNQISEKIYTKNIFYSITIYNSYMEKNLNVNVTNLVDTKEVYEK